MIRSVAQHCSFINACNLKSDFKRKYLSCMQHARRGQAVAALEIL